MNAGNVMNADNGTKAPGRDTARIGAARGTSWRGKAPGERTTTEYCGKFNTWRGTTMTSNGTALREVEPTTLADGNRNKTG